MYKLFLFIVIIFAFSSCKSNGQQVANETNQEHSGYNQNEDSFTLILSPEGDTIAPIKKSEEEWRGQLSEMEFYVIRDKGTERPFTSPLLKNENKGIYTCKACGLPLFESSTKYKSGTGWPSFYQPIHGPFIKEATDYDLGYARTEVMCARCDGHLGHVFNDGPDPTGLRYCINGVSLSFENKE